ncbi:MAG: flavoprotein [Candidatus Omnitrophota bacterium]|nr:flavoprotein [Candidatus Omnitrophota bacterium]MDZ4243195.1 flavoprotein [Candidatus Omnitrophota bacterium]
MSSPKKHVILGVTGSIAAYKAADVIRLLQEHGFEVSVLMTGEAKKFIAPMTLAALSGRPVLSDMFSGDEKGWEMPHIRLAKEAAALVIAPATAHTIAKLACGMADDVLTCTALATRAPLVIAPAMNEEMYLHPAVKENCLKLKKMGARWVEPVKGLLACGIVGQGHLAAVEDIVKAVVAAVKAK